MCYKERSSVSVSVPLGTGPQQTALLAMPCREGNNIGDIKK